MISDNLVKPENLPEVQSKILANGLEHVHITVADTATFSARVGLRAGALHADPAEQGSAHFLEHLVFSGTKKYPKKTDLYDLVDFVGGSHNAATGWHAVNYYVSLLARDADKALEFISEVLVNPLLRIEDFNREQSIITDEAKARLSSVSYLSWVELNKLYFGDRRWHTSAVGTPEDVKALDLEKITNFYHNHYRPDNAIIVTAGPQSFDDIHTRITNWFSGWEKGTTTAIAEPNPTIDSNQKFANFQSPMAEQTTIQLIKPGPTELQVSDYSQNIASAIIGGESYSRMFRHIREDLGLSYGLGTSIDRRPNYGCWHFGAGLDIENIVTFSSAYNQVIKDLKSKKVSESELQRAKNDLLTTILFECERTSALTDFWLSEYLSPNPLDSMEAVVDSIVSVTDSDVDSWIADYISAPSTILVTSKNQVSESDIEQLYEA